MSLGYIIRVNPLLRETLTKDKLAELEQIVYTNRLTWMQLVSQNPMPGGRFAPSIRGDKLPVSTGNPPVGTYVRIIENQQPNPISVAIYANFQNSVNGSGKMVKLSIAGDPSDEQVICYLGNTASAPAYASRESPSIVLKPKQALFMAIASDPVAFPFVKEDRFFIRVFDPAEYLRDENWEAR